MLFTSRGTAERALAEAGPTPDDRSDDEGAEPEGAEVADFRRAGEVVIGAEPGDAVLVHGCEDEDEPRLSQVLPTGDAPARILALERRGLVVVRNEDDGSL